VPPIRFLELESDTYFVTNNLTVFPFQLCSLSDISSRLLSTSQTVFNATPMRLSSHKSLAIISMLFVTHCVSYLTFLFNGIMLIKHLCMTCDALFRSRQMSTVKILLTGVSVTVKGLYLFFLHKILVIESQRTASIIRDQTSLSMHISQRSWHCISIYPRNI